MGYYRDYDVNGFDRNGLNKFGKKYNGKRI